MCGTLRCIDRQSLSVDVHLTSEKVMIFRGSLVRSLFGKIFTRGIRGMVLVPSLRAGGPNTRKFKKPGKPRRERPDKLLYRSVSMAR